MLSGQEQETGGVRFTEPQTICSPQWGPVFCFSVSLVQICKMFSYVQCSPLFTVKKSAPVHGEHILGFSNKTILSVKITWKIYTYITCLQYIHLHKFIKNPPKNKAACSKHVKLYYRSKTHYILLLLSYSSSSFRVQILQCQICHWSGIDGSFW